LESRWIGASVRRVEDPRLLVGASQYLDDLDARGALHVAILRSPHAHARIRSIDTSAAERLPGVAAVVTAASLGAANGPFPHPTWFPPNDAIAATARAEARPEQIRLLAAERVRYVGEPVAAVVAADRYLAEDALDLIAAEYEPLPVVVDAEAALAPDAPLLHPEWGDNVEARFRVTKGDPDAAFRAADHVVRERVYIGRVAGHPLEPRGVLAEPDLAHGGLTVWSSNQAPHWLRDAIADTFGLAPERVRAIAPTVGGGFGTKSMVYPEELLVPRLALLLRRVVKWVDDRHEHFLTAIQARDQVHDVELALRADGTILGLRDRYLVDAGASNVEALIVPYNTAAHLQGPYRIPSLHLDCTCVVTNKAPLSSYRGAGRPEAVWAMERILDAAARALGLDPAELRRRNTLRADEMPYDAGVLYRDGHPLVLDGGDYVACLERALMAIDYRGVRAEQARLRAAGRYLGVGLASYVEGTGIGPLEQAQVRVEPSGEVVVTIALPGQGQGHATVMAQVCAERLGARLEDVRVVQGDTFAASAGGGTIASRVAVMAGNAVADAAQRVRAKALAAAAALLEAAVDDLHLADGTISVVGAPGRALGLGQVAAALAGGNGRLAGLGPALADQGAFDPLTVTFANGVHAVVVEVDPESGGVALRRYVVVHDCGKLINPMIVEGQVAGGVAQGIGGALHEELIYDPNGQLLTASFLDYGLPEATDVPRIEVHHLETPSTRNPLELKGVGEAGAIAVAAAVAGAVEDALAPFGARVTRCPLTPERVTLLLESTQRTSA